MRTRIKTWCINKNMACIISFSFRHQKKWFNLAWFSLKRWSGLLLTWSTTGPIALQLIIWAILHTCNNSIPLVIICCEKLMGFDHSQLDSVVRHVFSAPKQRGRALYMFPVSCFHVFSAFTQTLLWCLNQMKQMRERIRVLNDNEV